ncbi:hypothetical protein [Thermomonospora sp. CIF 1]|uniref:hypothetical protein n=1 Tax=Thermomonospora sp. CIF 1 TaxID=1916083 RepID=UPI002579D7DE|nr:hypothetical protein [Thermomonospora sp. CIF 1]
MAHARRVITVGAAAAAALAMMVPPASASTTISVYPSGTPYSGGVKAELLGTATVTSSLGSATCNESVMNGTINSDGSNLTITSASFSNSGGNCTGIISSAITTENLPWTGGNATYNPVAGGRDGTVTIANFRAKATLILGITCTYGGNLTANAYNPNNPNRPVPGVNEAQVSVSGATINKVSGGILCPSSATVSATYKLTTSSGQSLQMGS